ncbi:MAG: trypsin-like serine protease [Myxococcales bacterium]|nr:trypsin-like serine protease [Myxococcales bacterium]MCB9692841.1 trypsin-like serine protease [Alphaproteobacteria bacterium]
MTPAVLALLASSAVASPRIVNGTEAGPDEYPEVVAVSINGGGLCTGSLIHPEWVLCAAHCFDDIEVVEADELGVRLPLRETATASGNTVVNFGSSLANPQLSVAADEVVVHANYASLPGPYSNGLGPYTTVDGYEGITNDISLIHLSEPVSRTPMALNTRAVNDTWIGIDVRQIGFGITVSGGGGSGTKRYADVPMVSYEPAHPLGTGIVTMFDAADGRGLCQGDSGGPGVRFQGDGYVQVGIASTEQRNCSFGNDMRVDLYIDWIETVTGVTVLKEPVRPPTFYCSHQLNPDSNTSIAIGTVPMDLQCIVDAGDPQTIEQVQWLWGDGTEAETVTTLTASHTYSEMGVYNLRACVVGERAGNEYTDCTLKASHVNACDVPLASFEATPAEGLRIDVTNTTSLRAHNCVSNALWEVYQGDAASGDPIISLTGWQPELDVRDFGVGTYTVVLNVGGLGGTGAAAATVEVGRGSGCSTGGLAPMLAPLAFLPLLGLRRRG